MSIMIKREEAAVFRGTDASPLRYALSPEHPILVRGPQTWPVVFQEGKDYIMDYGAGTIKRTAASRIPDWQEHPMFGLEAFDHREHQGYSNDRFTCMVEYTALITENPSISRMASCLPRLYNKLIQRDPIHYVVYGDSISAGYDASRPELDYAERFAAALRMKHPGSKINIHRKAVGGESSRGGLRRLREDVLPLRPDLVTIGYGMNDQNRQADGSNAIPVGEFEQNILGMVGLIREQSEAEVLLITPCLPNPKWIFSSENVTEYAAAIRRIGREAEVPVADLQRLWEEELAAGKTHESLLLNNLNHPNDYGHSVYFSAMEPFTS
jgi:acyl-CoA thioesterase-1